MWKFYIAACVAVFFSQVASAKTFYNNFVEFQLPEGWDCKSSSDYNWTCFSSAAGVKEKVSILLSAIENKPADFELGSYRDDLKRKVKDGKASNSQRVISADDLDIVGIRWVDSLQFQAKGTGRYSRILQTVVFTHLIRVEFKFTKAEGKHFKPVMEKIIKSLRAFWKPIPH
ncbi:MAG: hypothetical protein ACXWR1_09820 [Bdellovibrionota bacterium]